MNFFLLKLLAPLISLINALCIELKSHGSKTSTPLTWLFRNSAGYPETPASIGFPVAAYSKILEGKTF